MQNAPNNHRTYCDSVVKMTTQGVRKRKNNLVERIVLLGSNEYDLWVVPDFFILRLINGVEMILKNSTYEGNLVIN